MPPKKRHRSPVDVRQLLRATASSMWTTLAESAANERPDHKGIPREAHVRQFLRERLPPKWGVTRGHVFFAGDETTREFDVIVYDAQNCPRWTLGNGEDPRRLVPLEAVIGVIEVKSTLDDRTLAKAVAKIGEFDSLLDQGATESGYRPFRHIFAFELDRATDFGGWRAPCLALSRYAGARCQPDGIFVLDDHFSVLVREHGVGHVFGLHRGQTPAEVLQSSWDIQNEEIRRDIELDDSYCLDYFTTAAVDGLLLLAFLTFVIQRASAYQPTNVDYADLFCRWGGPALGGLMNFRSDDSDHVPVEF